MAGLIRNSTQNTGLPIFPRADKSSVTPYYSYDQSEAAYVHLPGFSASTGSSIRILQQSTTGFGATLYDINGNASNNGVWASGMTIAEGAGSANADRFLKGYMDASDDLFYMLFVDTSVSPNVLYFSKVNNAGTVTAIGNAALGNSSMNNTWMGSNSWGSLRRLGGDGSGNFGLYMTNTAAGNSGAGAPYQGVDITISASDGSLSYSTMMPSNYGNLYQIYSPYFGPTANGIIGGGYSQNGGFTGGPVGFYGPLLNTVSGRGGRNIFMGSPDCNGFPFATGAGLLVHRAKSKYVFSSISYSLRGTNTVFGEDELHAWLDDMAVYYGIL
tara:strand:- start:1042 stop:2025 length:984 start_codon:yes stop_codon:yes gene_type:complete